MDDGIVLSLGALGFAFGPGTIAGIVRWTDPGTVGAMLHAGGSSSSTRWTLSAFGAAGSEILQVRVGASTVNSPTAKAVVDEWSLIAVTKATGTVAPRFHSYRYSTGTWIHENGASTVANSGVPSGSAILGSYAAAGIEFEGDIGIVGAWSIVLDDAAIERLAFRLHPWRESSKGLWLLDQASVGTAVPDLSGGGANQSSIVGTTVGTTFVSNFDLGLPSLINRAAILRANHW